MTLAIEDFATFFEEIHGHQPFPWQIRLLRTVATDGSWPSVLDLPTGSGKTAAIDVAVYHLALEVENREARRAPVRIAFVVDRRLVVDDAYARAKRIERALRTPMSGSVSERVAQRLRALACDDASEAAPLLARRLRGGIPRESDWTRTPAQPTVLCSTVDQIGSRLLFRGYGVTDSMQPVHAGLLGSDCLVLLDEAHLAEPFRQTLTWIAHYHGEAWRQTSSAPPWSFSLLTATPGQKLEGRFRLEADDIENPTLSKRLRASKPVRLVKVASRSGAEDGDDEAVTARDDLAQRVQAIIAEVHALLRHFLDPRNGAKKPAIAIVVNRVARARAVHAALRRELADSIASGELSEPILMIGAARSIDRDSLADELDPIRTRTWADDETRQLEKGMLVVATQCLEAGVDIDLDGLVTEAAPIDALRQRFGRLNRAGRDVHALASAVAVASDLASRYEDPVYEKAIKPAWDYLTALAEKPKGGPPTIDVGLNAFSTHEQAQPIPETAISNKADAPVLLPAHLDLLSQTSPIPAADATISLYLHGPQRQPDSVSVIWRADIDGAFVPEDVRRLFMLVPPRAAEAIELPVWAVRSWLRGRREVDIPDVVAPEPADDRRQRSKGGIGRAFLWKGDGDGSTWIGPDGVYPGATLVVPSRYGGLDRFGWNADTEDSVTDVAREASLPFSGRRFAVRIAPGLLGSQTLDANEEAALNARLAATVASFEESRWSDLRDALLELPLPEPLRVDLLALNDARKGSVIPHTDLYGQDENDRPRGVVFLAPLGLKNRTVADDLGTSSTEDDATGSLTGYTLELDVHSKDVERYAERFASVSGLPDALVSDLKLAGYLHDAGKSDRRFQAWLQYGDPLGADPRLVLAKSGRRLPRKARSASGLPERWRHEALSVRLARSNERLASANDPMLVLWLVGTHHGYGRPFFPHGDPTEPADDVGPQSLAFQWRELDWAGIFDSLKARYGVWGLARLEAIVRLADHRASEHRAKEAAK